MRGVLRNCSDFVRALNVHSRRHTRESGYPLGVGGVFASPTLNNYVLRARVVYEGGDRLWEVVSFNDLPGRSVRRCFC